MVDKVPTLAEIKAAAAKKYDLRIGSITDIIEPVASISTGNLAIDTAIGTGGLPLKRMVELYGPPSSGKTTTALQAMVTLQEIIKAGGDPVRGIAADDVEVYFDFEQAVDVEYAAALGLDMKHESFLFCQPDNLEQGANVARSLLKTGKVRMMTFDSVAAMVPSKQFEQETGAANVALQARLMSDFLKVLVPELVQHNCAAVFINHMGEMINTGGSRPGMPPIKTTPGGKALKFYASVRCEYQQSKNIKGDMVDPLTGELLEMVVASDVRVKIVKNKLAPPFRVALTRVRFGRGFDNFWTAIQVLTARKHLVYGTARWYFERSPDLVIDDMPRQTTGTKRPYLGQGEDVLFEFADEHPEWRDLVIKKATAVVTDALAEPEGPILPEQDEDQPASTPEEVELPPTLPSLTQSSTKSSTADLLG